MGQIYNAKTQSILLWGRVTRDAQLRQTKSGKSYATLSVQYGKHHDEDGHMIRDYMDVSVWGDHGEQVGDPNAGVSKGDIVLVIGTLYKDDYKSEKDGKDVYSLNADVVLDATCCFQLASMVVGGEPIGDDSTEPSAPTSFKPSSDRTPFEDMMDEEDGELPY